jgi:hypothetical protein
MSQAQLAAMINRWAPGCVIRKIDTVFRTPIVVGTHPVVRGAVTDVDPDTRTIEIDLTIMGETGATGVLGTATVLFPEA